MTSKCNSTNLVFLFQLFGFTWTLLVLLAIMAITIWMLGDLLFVSITITPIWWPPRSILLVNHNLISIYQLCERVASSCILNNKSHAHRALWLIVFHFFWNIFIISAMCSIIDVICHADMLLMESTILEKSPSSSLLTMARIKGVINRIKLA